MEMICFILHFFAKNVVNEKKTTIPWNADKTLQNTAFQGNLRGEKTMIRVLFVCHGNIWLWHRKTSIYAVCEDLEDDFSTKLALLAKNKGHWVHLEWKMKQKLNIKVICMREGSSSSFFCAKNKNIRLAWTNFRHEAK